MHDAPDAATRVCVRRAPARPALADASLVLAAVDIPHALEFDGHQWCLFVPYEAEAEARRELETFQEENRPRAERIEPAAPIDSGWLGVLGYLLVIWALPWLENAGALGWSWRESGVLAVGRVHDGEWWRTVTALTLHGDLGHIVANSLFGMVFGLLAGRLYGSGVAWLLIVVGGMLGNLLNVMVQSDQFRSLGASTATFAALALVGATSWRRGYFRGGGWRRSLAPVFGGIAMLVYTGLGSEDTNTDVIGHLAGFVAGLALGVIAARWPVARGGYPLQWLAGAAALALVAVAWRSAGA
jgi:membrane associated rhomboid family serine protease